MRSEQQVRDRLAWVESHLVRSTERLTSPRLPACLKLAARSLHRELRRERSVLSWVLGGESPHGGCYHPKNLLARQCPRLPDSPRGARTCLRCGVPQSLARFSVYRVRPDGREMRRRACRKCENARQRGRRR